MRIAIDLRRIKNPGIGRYMRGLVEALLGQVSEHEFLLILPPGASDIIAGSGQRAEKLYCPVKYYSLHEQIELPRILRAHKIDLFHSPHFMMPLACPCPAVVTIHDVIYLACKEDLNSRLGRIYYRAMMNAAARRASRVVTVSEFSKSDIVRYLGVAPGKIEVIHSGIDPVFRKAADSSRLAEVRRKYSITNEFILYAGIYKPRKNHVGLLQAFQRLRSRGLDAQLVIAGPINEAEDKLKKLARDLGIIEDVVFTGAAEDSELAALYSAARVYACPSLYEGFGFTVLESMACGVPVVCSCETSLPEIAGDAALYADSRDPEQFANALCQAFTNDGLRTRLIAAGHSNCQRFSWAKAAASTTAVYESVRPAVRKAVYA